MADRVQKVTRRSYGERVKGSFGGVIVGVILLGVGVVLLFWNEGRTVKRRQTLAEGAASVRSIEAARPDLGNDGKLVHLTGEATARGELADPVFGVVTRALKLRRRVEMYQWVEESESEEKKKLGGGTETVTTYTYKKDWSSSAIDSSRFEEPSGHANPSSWPVTAEEWVAEPITLGAFTLGGRFVGQLDRESKLDAGDVDVYRLRERFKALVQSHGGGVYIGGDPSAPQVGDLRVTFEAVEPAAVSVVGEQRSGALESYRTAAGGDIALLAYGTVAADAMFEQAQSSNTMLSWILRLVGLLVLCLGFGLLLAPLSVLADVIPLLGNLVGAGSGLVAVGLGVVVGLVTIAAGWIFYRPLLGFLLLAAALALVVWLWRRGRQRVAQLPPLPKVTL